MRFAIARVAFATALVGLQVRCARVAGLPEVPDTVSAHDAGLDAIPGATAEARRFALPLADTRSAVGTLTASESEDSANASPTDAVDRAREARRRIRDGDVPGGLAAFADAVFSAPADLVVGNAFRMEVYRQKREFLAAEKARGERMPMLPEYLRNEPLATLQRAHAAAPGPEIGVQVALAYVDEMVLEPALEIRAPASINSVRAFRSVLEQHPYYVPALVGRGLNHLNRPKNLVWPEHPPPPPDGASRDLALACAVGAKVGGASSRVRGLLLLLLGDAHAHEGRPAVARSFWTIAGEMTDDAAVQRELEVRASWPEPDMPDRLEARLAERMDDTEHPVSDLSFLWSDEARGPW